MPQDGPVGLVGRQARELPARFGGHAAAAVHRDDDGKVGVVVVADLEVLDAVAGSGVHAAGAALQRDVVAHNHERGAVEERVGGLHILQLGALEGRDDLVLGLPRFLHGGFIQRGRHHEPLVPAADQRILELRADADGHVGGKGPRRRRPDHEIGVRQVGALRGEQPLVVRHAELDVDGIARVLGILDLRLGEGGFVVRAPVDRLQALIDIALEGHFAEDLNLLRLKAGVQRPVRVRPVAEHAQALELPGHALDM